MQRGGLLYKSPPLVKTKKHFLLKNLAYLDNFGFITKNSYPTALFMLINAYKRVILPPPMPKGPTLLSVP